jgi:thymidylate synthase (FAD)
MEVSLLEATSDPERLVCQAARNDYMEPYVGETPFEEVMASVEGDTLAERKETLIHHLLAHGHFGPFEHPHATFAIKGVSRSCMAQITRHRHASFDVQSMRYVEFDEENPEPGTVYVHIPELDEAHIAGRNAEIADEYNGKSDEELLNRRRELYHESIEESFNAYNELLDLGVAPENARMVLPIGTKVNMVVTLNARMLMHVADIRSAADAQWEVRDMTNRILDLAAEWCPITFGYYTDEMKGRKNRLAP